MIKLFLNDIKILWKYGIIPLYIFLSLMYIGMIHILPESIKNAVTILTVFTDPTALGFFFMGAIILFEKNEKVVDYLAITPISIDYYIISKILSLSAVSTVSGVLIFLLSGIKYNFFTVFFAVSLGSLLFSLIGIMLASRVKSLNQFIFLSIPIGILFAPSIMYYFGIDYNFMLSIPPVIIIRLLNSVTEYSIILILILLIWIILFFYLARLNVKKMFIELSGVKL